MTAPFWGAAKFREETSKNVAHSATFGSVPARVESAKLNCCALQHCACRCPRHGLLAAATPLPDVGRHVRSHRSRSRPDPHRRDCLKIGGQNDRHSRPVSLGPSRVSPNPELRQCPLASIAKPEPPRIFQGRENGGRYYRDWFAPPNLRQSLVRVS